MYFCEPPKRKGHPVLSMLCHRLLLNISIHADDGFAQRVDSHRERIHSALIAGSIVRDFSLCQLKNTLIATAVRIVGHPELFDLSGGKSQLLISRVTGDVKRYFTFTVTALIIGRLLTALC